MVRWFVFSSREPQSCYLFFFHVLVPVLVAYAYFEITSLDLLDGCGDARLQALEAGAFEQSSASNAEGSASVEYQWVREYHYEARPDEAVQDNMILFFKQGHVRASGGERGCLHAKQLLEAYS